MSKKIRVECCINRLPCDVMAFAVYSFLEPKDFCSVALTCKWFYNLLQNDPTVKIIAKSCYERFVRPKFIDGNEFSARLYAALIDWNTDLGIKIRPRPRSPTYSPSSPNSPNYSPTYEPSSPTTAGGEGEEQEDVPPFELEQLVDLNEPDDEEEQVELLPYDLEQLKKFL